MAILIKNGTVIDPYNKIFGIRDILVREGKIAKVAEKITGEAETVIDAKNKWVVPGLIDLHVHFREPGGEHKETVQTGAMAAARGGFTTVCCMPNTNPVADNEIVVEYIKSKARDAAINVLPIGSATRGQLGLELSNIGLMAEAGICAISEDGKTVENAGLYKTVMKYAAHFNLPVFSHCEEKTLSSGQINAGPKAALLGLSGIPNDAEDLIVARDIILAESIGGNLRLHICHISTAGSARLLGEAKARGVKVTGEAAPHHFTLTDEDIPGYDANYKMNPPLRSAKDVEAIKQALRDGAIDCIATDHAPHHYDDKNCEFANAANGIIGLETALPLSLELVRAGCLTPLQLVEKMSLNPARVMGINKGTLSEGAGADIAIIAPNEEYTIDITKSASKSRNSPFHGRKAAGLATHTICGGRLVYEYK